MTPWSVPIPSLHWPQTFGWQSPLGIVISGAMIVARVNRFRHYAGLAVVIAGLVLLAWAGWVSAQLLSPPFRASGFPFLPIDLLGEGWYVSVLAFAITVDGLAQVASDDERPPRPVDVWPFSLVAGAGLIRMRYPARGRLWMAAAAFSVFLLDANAVAPSEFQFYGSFGGLPPPRPRVAALIPLALGLFIWLASLRDTQQKLSLEQDADACYPAATALSRGADPSRRAR